LPGCRSSSPASACVTGDDGRFSLGALPAGALQPVSGGSGTHRVPSSDAGDESRRELNIELERNPLLLGLVHVTGVSRTPERIVEAPAAVVVAEPARIREMAATGQVPLLVGDLTGVHIAQSGLYDFSLNTRGFNSATNRRTLVLVDGRDISIRFSATRTGPTSRSERRSGGGDGARAGLGALRRQRIQWRARYSHLPACASRVAPD